MEGEPRPQLQDTSADPEIVMCVHQGMQAHTYIPCSYAWFREGSAAGGRTVPFPSKWHRFPSCAIFLPVCHCLLWILEIVLGRWMTRFICEKEGNSVLSSRPRLIGHAAKQFEDGVGNRTQACSFFSNVPSYVTAEAYFQYGSVPLELESGATFRDRSMFADKMFM